MDLQNQQIRHIHKYQKKGQGCADQEEPMDHKRHHHTNMSHSLASEMALNLTMVAFKVDISIDI